MMQRTTVSLNNDYLDELKLLALKRKQSLSQLMNEAVSRYLRKVDDVDNNREFFKNLQLLKKDLGLNKKELKNYVQKGRL